MSPDNHPSNLVELPTANPDEMASLLKAIQQAAIEIQPIPKEYNNDLRYSVRSWDAIRDAIAPVLWEHGLMIYPVSETVEYRETNGLPKVVLSTTWRCQHVDGGYLECADLRSSHAEFNRKSNGTLGGATNNPEGAARTYSERDFTCRLLNIPTGEAPAPELTDAGAPMKEKEMEGDARRLMANKAHEAIQDVAELQREALKEFMVERNLWYTPNEWTVGESIDILNYLNKGGDS